MRDGGLTVVDVDGSECASTPLMLSSECCVVDILMNARYRVGWGFLCSQELRGSILPYDELCHDLCTPQSTATNERQVA
jgi:hypothetical protein